MDVNKEVIPVADENLTGIIDLMQNAITMCRDGCIVICVEMF